MKGLRHWRTRSAMKSKYNTCTNVLYRPTIVAQERKCCSFTWVCMSFRIYTVYQIDQLPSMSYTMMNSALLDSCRAWSRSMFWCSRWRRCNNNIAGIAVNCIRTFRQFTPCDWTGYNKWIILSVSIVHNRTLGWIFTGDRALLSR